MPQKIPAPFAAPPAPEAEFADERAQRAAIVGQLAGGILHDFNNVLTVISGTIEILAEAVADRPQLAAVAKLIDGAATRGARLATHLIAFASGEPSGREEVDVNALLGEAASLLRPALGGSIEIAFEPADERPAALADPGQLLAAILSLGIAVRDARPEGGTLTLRAAPSHAATGGAVTIKMQALDKTAVGKHPLRRPIQLRFVEGLVARSGGDLVFRADDGTSLEIVLPRWTGSRRS
jgi:signal transduction histidine kinase